MEDVITLLQFLQKLEQGKLIPTEQIEHLADILKSTLRKNLSNGVYDSLNELLESQLNGNEQNPLFIDILETTPKPEGKDTLTKLIKYLDKCLIKYLDKISQNEQDFEYHLDFKIPAQNKEYIAIFKDSDQGYILKYANISDYSKYIHTIPLKDLDKKYIEDIWDTIEEDEDNWKEIKEGIKEEMANK